MAIELKNKKILVMGLGLLGGGIATTKWLVLHGANVTVTDLRSRGELKDSINKLGAATKKLFSFWANTAELISRPIKLSW